MQSLNCGRRQIYVSSNPNSLWLGANLTTITICVSIINSRGEGRRGGTGDGDLDLSGFHWADRVEGLILTFFDGGGGTSGLKGGHQKCHQSECLLCCTRRVNAHQSMRIGVSARALPI